MKAIDATGLLRTILPTRRNHESCTAASEGISMGGAEKMSIPLGRIMLSVIGAVAKSVQLCVM